MTKAQKDTFIVFILAVAFYASLYLAYVTYYPSNLVNLFVKLPNGTEKRSDYN